MAKRYLWVVEMDWREGIAPADWHPTVGARRTRREGRSELRHWQAKNPDDVFRVVRYSAEDK